MAALLALFARSLRELIRAPLAHWACSAMVGVIFLFLLAANAGATATTAPGLKFFFNVLAVVLVFTTLAGVTYFATAITEEKEEGTLPLLRMTDLSPLAILLGKSTSRLSAALLVLAATLPFTLLAVTLGGISARQVFASYLCLGSYLALLANVAASAGAAMVFLEGSDVLLPPAIASIFVVIGLPVALRTSRPVRRQLAALEIRQIAESWRGERRAENVVSVVEQPAAPTPETNAIVSPNVPITPPSDDFTLVAKKPSQ